MMYTMYLVWIMCKCLLYCAVVWPFIPDLKTDQGPMKRFSPRVRYIVCYVRVCAWMDCGLIGSTHSAAALHVLILSHIELNLIKS